MRVAGGYAVIISRRGIQVRNLLTGRERWHNYTLHIADNDNTGDSPLRFYAGVGHGRVTVTREPHQHLPGQDSEPQPTLTVFGLRPGKKLWSHAGVTGHPYVFSTTVVAIPPGSVAAWSYRARDGKRLWHKRSADCVYAHATSETDAPPEVAINKACWFSLGLPSPGDDEPKTATSYLDTNVTIGNPTTGQTRWPAGGFVHGGILVAPRRANIVVLRPVKEPYGDVPTNRFLALDVDTGEKLGSAPVQVWLRRPSSAGKGSKKVWVRR